MEILNGIFTSINQSLSPIVRTCRFSNDVVVWHQATPLAY